MKRRVVITGMGVVTPIGIGTEVFWDSLKNGRSGVGRLTFFDTTDYSCQIDAEVKGFQPDAYIDKKNIRRMDRFTQFAFAAADMAVRDAGLDTAKVEPDRVGVIVGSGIGGLSTIEEEHSVLRDRGAKRVSPFLIPRLISNIAPGKSPSVGDLPDLITPFPAPVPHPITPSAIPCACCATETPT